MGFVALLVLIGVTEPEVGCSVVLVGHLWVACASGVGILSVIVHFLVVEVGNLSLNIGGFHNGNTT